MKALKPVNLYLKLSVGTLLDQLTGLPPETWLEGLKDNYSSLFLSRLSFPIQEELRKGQKLSRAMANHTICLDLVNLAYILNGKTRPTLPICESLAGLLRANHPENFATVQTLKHGEVEAPVMAGRGRGGGKGNINLGKRLYNIWYESNRRVRKRDALPLDEGLFGIKSLILYTLYLMKSSLPCRL